MSDIAVLANVHLLSEAQEQIDALASQPLVFPKEETQPTLKELIHRTGNAPVVLVSPATKVSPEYLQACPQVRYIGVCGTSKENIAVAEAEQRGILVTNVVDYGDEPTAEFIFMQLTSLARGTGKCQWREQPVELMGKSIGIIGLGALGKAVAHLALAYRMNVTYNSRTRNTDWEQRGLKYLERLELLSANEIIVLTGPTDVELIGEKDFSIIRPNTILLQASQGNCFNRGGFLRWIATEDNVAIFDYAAGHENYLAYKDLPRVVFPKVIAGHTFETKQRLGKAVVNNLKTYLGVV